MRTIPPRGLRLRAALRTKRRTCRSPGSASGTAHRRPLARLGPASSEPPAASLALPPTPARALLRLSRASPVCPPAVSAVPCDAALADVGRSPDRRSGGPDCLSHSDRRSRDGRGQLNGRGVKTRFRSAKRARVAPSNQCVRSGWRASITTSNPTKCATPAVRSCPARSVQPNSRVGRYERYIPTTVVRSS